MVTIDSTHRLAPHDERSTTAHHFDTAPQQFSASKLGMWLFLATEVLFFGGLFVFYAVQRANNPEIFAYGASFLDWRLGCINTVVLILSSVTMAIGVTASQHSNRRMLLWCLATTFLGGVIFMTIKYFEYSHKIHENIVWGLTFYEEPEHEGEAHAAVVETAEPEGAQPGDRPFGDAARGKELFLSTCRGCHGVRGEGVAGQGKPHKGSKFIAEKSDEELLAFIKVGRMPFDPLNTTGIQMPPRGGNPTLTDDKLRDIIAYTREYMAEWDRLDAAEAAAAAAGGGDQADGALVEAPALAEPEEFYIPRSSIPDAAIGPVGVSSSFVNQGAASMMPYSGPRTMDPHMPRNAHVYFGVYYCLTGLHGIHVLVGMGLMLWLFLRAWRGDFGRDYFTPVDLGGLYWHLVDLIWIFLFPLLYLI